MSSIGIAVLVALPSAIITLAAALCLVLIRRHHRQRHTPHDYCLVLERDLLIAIGMAMLIYFCTGVGAYFFPTLGATPLDGGLSYTIARVTGLLIFANVIGCGAFVARRMLWWAGRHPLQLAAQGEHA